MVDHPPHPPPPLYHQNHNPTNTIAGIHKWEMAQLHPPLGQSHHSHSPPISIIIINHIIIMKSSSTLWPNINSNNSTNTREYQKVHQFLSGKESTISKNFEINYFDR
jgi:hypothetical protein